uniref:DNA-directed RNA polymerase III subunit RPC3 n=1 Tax=Oryza meridionalis TaxID=40149 RepID=A0A0E0C625_9ORYZ
MRRGGEQEQPARSRARACKVCRCLLRHGALPLQEIVRRLELSPGQVKNSLLVLIQHNCVQAFNAPREALLEGLLQNGSITPAREEIRMNFNKLVFAHYVERCPKPEPFFDPLVDEQSTSSRKRAPKIPYIMEDASNANDSPLSSISGAKRKHNALEGDAELDSTIAENEVLWRANFEKFTFCLKKKFCADRKKPKLKVGTHPIWEAFFEASLIERDSNSVTSPINGIMERLGQKEGGTSMTLDHITRVLEELNCSPSSEDPDSFILDLSRIVEASRNEEIESLVRKKYGQEAFTIFRLLVRERGPVETDKIIDTTILDKQIVHGTLYKLWKDDYIDTERILSGTGTGTGNTQYFVWRVKNTFREQFIDNLCHAALNLRQMVNYIAELLLEGSKDDTKLRNRKNILILALTRHDDSLMLFQDF